LTSKCVENEFILAIYVDERVKQFVGHIQDNNQ